MGRLRKVCPKDVPLVSLVESADSSKDPFVPKDFAVDGSNAMSLDCSGDDEEFDKALYKFYVDNKVKNLKRKLSSVSRRNVRQKRSSDFPACSTFTRYSGKFFSGVVDGMCPRYKGVIQDYGMGCLLDFVRTEVPLRLVKWLASRFDVLASEFQLKRKFIPLTKYDIHDILDLPVDGEPLVCDPESGRDFILSHFNLTSIPPVSFFANKLHSVEVDLPDEDVFICFMIVAFSTFLCPNSSLSPSPKYLHIFQDCRSMCAYDLSSFVYEWLLSSIKKFKDATKVASKRSVTFGGCHYAFAVSYLDHWNFGLHSVPDVKPRILAWRGNKVKQFAELDRNNSRSFGKRPLKRLCAPVNLQGSVEKSSGSKSVDIGPSDVSFAVKVQRTIGPRFGSQAALEVIELVQNRNQDKPKIFIDWAESLVINALECVLNSSMPKVSGSEHQSISKFSFGNKSVSIQSAIANGGFAKVDGIPEAVVQQETHPLSSPDSPIVPPAVLDGGLHNPVVLSSSTTPARVRDEAVVNEGPVPICALLSEDKSKGSISIPAVPPKGNSPSKSDCGIADVDSFVLLSDGPTKICQEKDIVNAFGIPSLAELNRALGIQSPAKVRIDTPVHADGKSPVEQSNSFRDLSPLVPVRLSQYFRNELGDVQCSQYAAERFLKLFNSPNDEDCIVMVNLPQSDISKPPNHVKPPTVDLCSPDVNKKTLKAGLKVNEAVVDVHKVGSSNFAARCQELSRSNDVAYKKLRNIAAPASSNRNPIKVANSPELKILSDITHISKVAGCSNAAPSFQLLGDSTASSFAAHVPRRMVVPGRFNSDPYVPQVNRYAVTPLERRYHQAMIQIASHPEWCKYEAIRYERAYCSYRNLSSLQFKAHVDNFLILCVCRYHFNEAHPSISKKHFFFSYIGEAILDGTNAEIVGNAFNGANSAFAMWRSNMLYFPLCRFSHWFSFVVCLKEKLFVFLDSLYGQFSDFHLAIRDTMVNNFINLWDMYVTPILRKRIDFENFEIVYPAVPQQNNTYDCGVFSTMYMKHWTPRTPIGNLFSQADIDNIRIKLANELFFSPFNSADKSFVTNFFDDVQN